MVRYFPLLALSALIACSADLVVPENVLIDCSAGRCPDGYNCNNAHLCVPSTSDDAIAPTVTSASYSPVVVGAGGTSQLSLDVSEPLLIDPVVHFTNTNVQRAFTIVSKNDTHYELTYVVRGDETDGESSVSADLIDLVGNTNTAVVPSLVIDQKPASIIAGSTALTLSPKRASNPLTEVTAITSGTRVRLTFATSEPITAPPLVTIGGTLQFTATASSSTVFIVDTEWNAPELVDGVQTVDVLLVDAAGNTSTSSLDVTSPTTPNGFLVDTTPPRAPVNTRLRRAPWGEIDGTAPAGRLEGGMGAVDPGTQVVAYDAPSVDYCTTPSCSFASLGVSRAIADANGAFTLDIGQNDRRIVYLVAIDEAGNTSDVDPVTTGLQPTPVASAALIATFNALPGRTNPNTASTVERLPRLPGDIVSGSFDAAALRRRGDASVDIAGGYFWDTYGVTAGVPVYSGGSSSAAALPRFGQVLISALAPHPFTSTVTSTWLRDAGGLTQLPAIRYSTLAYDPANDGVLAIASGETRLWDGAQWSSICSGNTCNQPPTSATVIASDVGRGVVVWLGDNGGTIYEWDGARWSQKCTDTACSAGAPAIGSGGAGTYDGVSGEVLVMTTSRETWSWNGSRWLQRCTACGPSKRTDAVMGYDEARHQVVLYGGTPENPQAASDVGSLTDTWTWNGSSWRQESPLTSPGGPARERGMAFDVRRQRLVMMGGYYINTYPTTASDTFWEWDGKQWTRPRDFNGTFDAIGFDPQSRTTIGTGAEPSDGKQIRVWNGLEWVSAGTQWPGNASGALTRSTYGANDRLVYYTPDATFVFRDGTMQQKCSSSGCGLTSGGLNGASLASDGVDATLYSNGFDVFRFNGTSWAKICTGCGDYQSPAMSYDGSLTVGAKTGFLVSLGGYMNTGSGVYLDDGMWKNAFTPSLTGVVSSVLTYDAGRGALAWIGGLKPPTSGGMPTYHTTLEYISGGVSARELFLASTSPATPTVSSPKAAYDEQLQALIIFESSSGVTYTYSGSADRPALVLNIPLLDVIDLESDVLDAYTINWYGTTSSASGIGAFVWNYDHWAALEVSNEGDHWAAKANTGLLRALSGLTRTLTVAITPASTNGAGRATLSTDAVDAEIAYHAGQ